MFDTEYVASIIAHMNDDHSEAVLAYAQAFADSPTLAENVLSAKMVGFDETGIELECEVDEHLEKCRINYAATGLTEKLETVEGARALLVAMVKLAREKLAQKKV